MSKSFSCRLAVVQISANPAYADELVALIQEPAFPGDEEKIGLFSIAGIETINALRQSVAEQYVLHLNQKLEAIIRFAANCGVELLVFPEYSIPAESLPLCRNLAEELKIAIVAGSHIVTISSSARDVYKQLGLELDQGSRSLGKEFRHAVCIVFVPGQPTLAFSKHVRSKWETVISTGASAFHAFDLQCRSGKIEVQVLICIEALSEISTPKEKHTHPRVVAIPAFTPSTRPFHNMGDTLLLQGKCTLLANVAEFGGSKAFVRAERANLWFTTNNGTMPIPKDAEALLVIDADLEKQFEVRKSVTESTALSDVKVYPLLYPGSSSEAQQYVQVIDSLGAPDSATLDEIGTRIEPFTSLTTKVFPKFLQEKLQQFTSHVVPAGAVLPSGAGSWYKPVVVTNTPSTNLLRWELCNQAIQTVNQLVLSGKHVAKSKELMDVMRHLLGKRDALTAHIQPPEALPPPPAVTTTQRLTAESAFFDREHAFDKIRAFMGQPHTTAFLLSGMRGIGKTHLVEEAFRQAIPPRKKVWIQLTEGISRSRLLAELAYACNIRIPTDLDLSSPERQTELEQRLLAYLSQGPGAVVVIDDFQYLLSAGDIEDLDVRSLFVKFLENPERTRSKFILISNIAPKLGPDLESRCASYSLRGLRNPDSTRLLEHWYHFRRGEVTGESPIPPERVMSILDGHPLAIKVAARLCADHPDENVLDDITIFKELRDTIVPFILEQISLSGPEADLLSFASVFRLPVPREVFVRWKGEEANFLLNSLASHYLIETSERGYQLHPLVREFYYDALTATQVVELHKIAGKFYIERFDKAKAAEKLVIPEYLGEAIHHYLAAGERQRVQGMAFYKQELRPVAISHYRRGDYKMAEKDYRVLIELDSLDADAHLHLALIYAREKKWGDAEHHFGKAITVRPKAYWIFQAYGAAKLRAGKLAEAEQLLTEAEELNPHHPATLVDLGRLHEKRGDVATAENYYKGAIELDPENGFAHYQLAGLLYQEDQISEAFEHAKMALSTRPTDERNRKLVEDLRERLRTAGVPGPTDKTA